jgi:hypothetical protein
MIKNKRTRKTKKRIRKKRPKKMIKNKRTQKIKKRIRKRKRIKGVKKTTKNKG